MKKYKPKETGKPENSRVETEDRERRNMNIRRFGDERGTEEKRRNRKQKELEDTTWRRNG